MKTRRLLAALAVAGAFLALPARAALAQEHETPGNEPTATVPAESNLPAESGEEEPAESTEEHGPANEAAEECIHLLEEGKSIEDCQKAPSLIMPATNELIWGSLAFIIVFAGLAKFGYPAIKKGMEDRSNRIRENIDESVQAKNEAQGILEEYQRQLADARTESNRIIEEARQTADQLRRDLVTRAEQEAQELRQRTQDDILAAQQRAMADVQMQIRDLTIDLAEKIVERQLDRDTNRALVDGFIAELERN